MVVPVLQGCGGREEEETLTIGDGTELTVRTDGTPKEQAISLIEALNEEVDFDEAMEACILDRTKNLDEDEFPELDGLSPDETFAEGASFTGRFSLECRPNDNQVIEENPSEGTVSLVRSTFGRSLQIQAEQLGGTPTQARCAEQAVLDLSEEELVTLINQEPAEVLPFIRETLKDCA